MADNYLITGYWGEPHVTAENDRGINAAMFGTGRFVLPVGRQFEAAYIGNNTIRLYDGKLMDNGAAAGIPAGEYVDLLIANAGQGKKRNDLIVFQYSQDASTLIESGKFVVIQGEETSGTASDPVLTQEDLLSGNATFDQMPLYRVSVSGATIAAPTRVAEVEWANPPMIMGEEYRTTERWNGNPVYTKLLDCGKLPNATHKDVSIGVTISDVVFCGVIATDTANNWRYQLPYIATSEDAPVRCHACVVGNVLRIFAANGYDASGFTGKAILKYTKY